MAQAAAFTTSKAPKYSPNLAQELKALNPNIFLVCFRSKNRNVVVYQTRVSADGKLLDPPVEAYWLILEPSYQRDRKKHGIQHDREELGRIDKMFAWGFSSTKQSDTGASFKFNMFDHDLHIKVDQKGAKLFTTHDNKKYYLRTLYIESSEHIKLMNIQDNVKRLSLDGFDITSEPYRPATVVLKGS